MAKDIDEELYILRQSIREMRREFNDFLHRLAALEQSVLKLEVQWKREKGGDARELET